MRRVCLFSYFILCCTLSFQSVSQVYTFKFINAKTQQPVRDIHVNILWDIYDIPNPALDFHIKKQVYVFHKTAYTPNRPLKLSIFPPDYYFPGSNIGGAIVLSEKFSKVHEFDLHVLPTLKISLIKKDRDSVTVGIKIPYAKCDDIEKKIYLKHIKKYNSWSCYELSDTLSAIQFVMLESAHTLYTALENEVYLDFFYADGTVKHERFVITPTTKELSIIISRASNSFLLK